jgi:tRNA pseudouridine65 synthase
VDTPLEILYQDDWLVAINKPSGLLVHRTALDTQASEFAVQTLRDQLGRPVHPCHRLDRPTSGVLLFALDKTSCAQVSQSFADGVVEKRYHAIVRGWTDPVGRIDTPLRSEEYPEKTQSAETNYRRLFTLELPHPVGRYASARFSWLELAPKTGRTHQLRRHLAHIRHPILGDTRHGDGKQNRFARETLGLHRLMLHATELRLPHPQSGQPLLIQSETDAWRGLLHHDDQSLS